MKVLLTGITGNLGYEVYRDLIRRGIEVVPCVREGKAEFLSSHGIKSNQMLVCDLANNGTIDFPYKVDCIVHCAGDVRFKSMTKSNERMMISIIKLAKGLSVPIYFTSTAFVYKSDATEEFNNNYELDKYTAEQALVASGLPHTIFRPSVLVGNSKSGEILNFSGYYSIAKAFLVATGRLTEQEKPFRFPKMSGTSNIVPVDQAAECIGAVVAERRLGETLYIVNPKPPRCDWVLDETLKFLGIRQNVLELDISLDEFAALDLTENERMFMKYMENFLPYWSLRYSFPESMCTGNQIDQEYLKKILNYFVTRSRAQS